MANFFANIPVPAANGVGAIVDVSLLGAPLTFISRGDYLGGIVVTVEVSEEAAGPDFFPLSFTFQESGEVEIGPETIRRVRSRVFGFTGGVPALDVAGSDTAGGGSAITSPRDCFVFRPGGVATENVYISWPALITALGVADGCKTIEFDDTIVSPIVIPVGGPYPMLDTTWSAGPNPATGAPTEVEVPEGVTFANLRKFTGNLLVRNLATITSPVSDFVTSDGVLIQDGATIESAPNTVAFFSGAALAPGNLIALIVNDVGNLGTPLGPFAPAPVVDLPVAGTVLLTNLLDASVIRTDTVAGAVGTLWIRVYNSTSSFIDASQPSFLGTLLELVLTPGRMALNPAPPTFPSATAVVLSGNEVARLTTATGPISQPLPLALGLFGQRVVVKQFAELVVGAFDELIIFPVGGNTIDGVAGFVTISRPFGSREFLSDGISDWITVGGYSVFGEDYQSVASLGVTNTTLATFVTKVSLTTPAFLTGTYRVEWYYLLDSPSGAAIEARLQNTTDVATLGGLANFVIGSTTQTRPVYGDAEILFAGASKTLEIQFRDVVGGNSQNISQARIALWRVTL